MIPEKYTANLVAFGEENTKQRAGTDIILNQYKHLETGLYS